MYIDQYQVSNATNICLPIVSADARDRWTLPHTFLPFVLVYVHQMESRDVMLLVYIWETMEIGFATCVLNIDIAAFEKMPDTIIFDPYYGALGILVGWMCTRARRVESKSLHVGWAFVTILPATCMWFINDDIVAQVVFGATLLVVSSLVDARLHGRTHWAPRLYIALTTLAACVVPTNPFYITSGMSILFVLIFACEHPSHLPVYKSAR